MQIKFTIKAQNKLNDITDYIAYNLKNPQAALDLIDDIEKTTQNLPQFPNSHKTYITYRNTDFKAIYIKNYVLMYHTENDCLFIDYIEYAKRGKKSILKGLLYNN